MIEAVHLKKRYRGGVVLSDVGFVASTGTTTCVIGQNGSGKSTLLSILAGHLTPDGGGVLVDGKPLTEARGRIGYVPQGDSLFEALTARDNVAFWASASGLGMKSPQVRRYMELLGVTAFESKKVKALSGGMRRRLAICLALLHEPACLLLDEPFAGLDLVVKEELFSCLEGIMAGGRTVVFTTHNLDEVGRLAGKCLVLRDGGAFEVKPESLTGDVRQSMLNLIKGEVGYERMERNGSAGAE